MKKIFFYTVILISFGFNLSTNEKPVNTFTISYQREPVIAINKSTGKYLIVWTSNLQDGDGDGIFGQFFDKNDNKIGKEFQVNTTTKLNQNKPAVASSKSGKFIVVWASTKNDSTLQDIYGQLYNESGTKIGNEFLINTTTIFSQNCPDVAMDERGNFVVAWHSWNQDGGDRGVYAQKFRDDGSKIETEFLVNTYTKYSQCEPSIAMTADGRFVVVWQSWGQENPTSATNIDYGIYGQIFNADCSKNGSEFQVNSTMIDDQFYPSVSISDSGNFIVAWTNWVSYDSSKHDQQNYGEVYAQRFDSKGNKIGNEFQANTTVIQYQWVPSIAINNDYSFCILWSSWKQDGSREGVYLQFFDRNANKINKEYLVNNYTDNYQWEPRIVYNKKNEILIAYSSWGQDGDDYGVFLRKVNLQETE